MKQLVTTSKKSIAYFMTQLQLQFIDWYFSVFMYSCALAYSIFDVMQNEPGNKAAAPALGH